MSHHRSRIECLCHQVQSPSKLYEVEISLALERFRKMKYLIQCHSRNNGLILDSPSYPPTATPEDFCQAGPGHISQNSWMIYLPLELYPLPGFCLPSSGPCHSSLSQPLLLVGSGPSPSELLSIGCRPHQLKQFGFKTEVSEPNAIQKPKQQNLSCRGHYFIGI